MDEQTRDKLKGIRHKIIAARNEYVTVLKQLEKANSLSEISTILTQHRCIGESPAGDTLHYHHKSSMMRGDTLRHVDHTQDTALLNIGIGPQGLDSIISKPC